MNYHNITHHDMLNGEGLRTVLWVSGCSHHCPHCQNPQTHPINSGIPFDTNAEQELFDSLSDPYCAGVTFSGGDPLHPNNREEIARLAKKIKAIFGTNKTIWLYTGYCWEEICDFPIISTIDVLCDGRFIESLADNNILWVGSSNQRVIDVQKTLTTGKIIMLDFE